MSAKNILIISKKEIRSFFNDPTAYIVVLVFILLWEFLFFRDVFLVGETSLRSLFGFLPWIMLFIIPALSMGSFSQEKNEGTLEILLTRPLGKMELILGKFFGILCFWTISFLFVLPLAWSLSQFGNLDWGEFWGQFLAGILSAGMLLSLGIFISGLFSTQISAFLVSATANFFLIIAGTELLSARLPLSFSSFLEQLSLLTHFDSLSRGVIDARDIWYFISLTTVFLVLTYLNFLKNKYGNRRENYQNLRYSFFALLGIVVFSNILGAKIPGRIDLTEEKIYTLSQSTKEIAGSLPDIVNINLYASDNLPVQLQPILRDTKDILEDYRLAGQGKIRLSFKNPSTDSAAASEAISQNIQPMRFNVVSQEEFQVKEGYLGISVSYGGENETIPFVNDISDLEYQLSGFLRKLTVEKKPKIAFISGHGEKSLFSDYRSLNEELGKQFEIKNITAESDQIPEKSIASEKEPPSENEKKFEIDEDVKTVILADPKENFSSQEKKVLENFLSRGGSALFLAGGVNINPETLTAVADENNFTEIIKELTGVEIRKDLVYDLRSNETVGFGGGSSRFFLPYPFWVRAIRASSGFPITSELENLVLPWASSLEIDEQKTKERGYKKDELFFSSDYAGTQTSEFALAPDQKFSSAGLSKKLLSLALSPEEKSSNRSRVVIVANSDFLSDQFIGRNSPNLSFALEALSWLSQEPALSQIGIKNIPDRKLIFKDESDPNLIKFGNFAFVFAVTAGYGFFRLSRRKKMKEKIYE